MKVYIVWTRWVNSDGWPIADSIVRAVFLDQKKAQEFADRMKIENPGTPPNHSEYYIHPFEVEDA